MTSTAAAPESTTSSTTLVFPTICSGAGPDAILSAGSALMPWSQI
jgi:hypothetical protein